MDNSHETNLTYAVTFHPFSSNSIADLIDEDKNLRHEMAIWGIPIVWALSTLN